MKRILVAAMGLLALVSCGTEPQMYFDNSNNRTYNDPNAEFDTLSYVVGMNIGLGFRSQFNGLDVDSELLLATLKEDLSKEYIDFDLLDSNKESFNKFVSEHMRPYTFARMRAMGPGGQLPDSVLLPSIYGGEFTPERVAQMFGHDIAGHIVGMAFPINIHWFVQAYNDAQNVEQGTIVDSCMKVSYLDARIISQKYYSMEYSNFVKGAAANWLSEVSKKRGVEPMVVETGDTLYYRIDKAGDQNKPLSNRDTIAISYDLYTRSGKLIESLDQRVASLRDLLDEAKADTASMDNPMHINRIKMIETELNKAENLRIPVSQMLLKGMQYAVMNIGVGGEITVWMPSTLAFGSQGNNLVSPNDAVVARLQLKDVVTGPTAEQIEAAAAARRKLPQLDVFPGAKPDASQRGGSSQVVITPVQK
jgi:FKBP-type peptidyl-prolyl cis-trans isomerase 2